MRLVRMPPTSSCKELEPSVASHKEMYWVFFFQPCQETFTVKNYLETEAWASRGPSSPGSARREDFLWEGNSLRKMPEDVQSSVQSPQANGNLLQGPEKSNLKMAKLWCQGFKKLYIFWRCTEDDLTYVYIVNCELCHRLTYPPPHLVTILFPVGG